MREKLRSGKPLLQFSDLTILIIVFVAWLYTMGWTYLRHYFLFFEIGLIGEDIPREFFLQFGWEALQDRLGLALFLYGLGGLFLFLWNQFSEKFTERFKGGRVLMWTGGSVLLLLFFMTATELGKASARDRFEEQLDSRFGAYPSVQLELKSDPKILANYDPQVLRSGDYRLLLQTKARVYLILPPSKTQLKDNPKMSIPTLSIPQTQIHTILTYPRQRL